MDWTTILSYLNEGERDCVKFLTSVDTVDQLGPILVAMANMKGGKVFIGVDSKNYHLAGTKIDREWVMDLVDTFCSQSLSLGIEFFNKHDKIIMIIDVPQSENKPCYFKNMCYVMDGAHPKLALLERKKLSNIGQPKVLSESDQVLNATDLQTITSELLDLTQDEDDSVEQAEITFQDNLSFTAQPESSSSDSPPVEFDSNLKASCVVPSVAVTQGAGELSTHDSSIQDQAKSEPLSDNQGEPLQVPECQADGKEPEKQGSLNERQSRALAHLLEHQSIRNKKYRELFSVSHKTAHLELVDMVEKGYIQSTGSGRSTHYIKA